MTSARVYGVVGCLIVSLECFGKQGGELSLPYSAWAIVGVAWVFGAIRKIGYAKAPKHRLVRLQVGNPNELWIVCVVPGSPDDEAAFHRRFAHLRVRGEWFRFGKDLKDAIAPYVAATLAHKVAEINRDTEELKALLALRGAAKSGNGGGTWL